MIEKSYYKDTGYQSEIFICNEINNLLDENYYCEIHSDNKDYYDLKIINWKTRKVICHIEFEKIDKNSNSNWKKGNCWWAYKRGLNKKNEPWGIHIPYRKKKYFEKYQNIFWLKCNRTYDSYIIIEGKSILKYKYQKFDNFRSDYGSKLYHKNGIDIEKDNDGIVDKYLEECLSFIEKKLLKKILKKRNNSLLDFLELG